MRKLHNGARMYVYPNDHIQQQIFWYGYYEKDAVLCWEALSGKDSVVLDIGANTGYYSLIAAAKGATVYAFEPVSQVRQELTDNIALNPELRIHPVATALGAGSGMINIFIAGADNRGMSGFHQPDNFSGQTEQVPLITADTWAAGEGIGNPSLIKIDTEGAEPDILKGMQELIGKGRPDIFMELMPEHLQRSGHTPADIHAFFAAMQYDAFLPLTGLQLQALKGPSAADVIIFHPREREWPACFRILP